MRELNIEATGIFRAILDILGKRDHCHIDNAQSNLMPIVVERLNENHYSLTHYSELNGDLMSDPDITFWFNPERRIYAASYRNDYSGIDRQAIEFEQGKAVLFHHAFQKKLTGFANQWLRVIAEYNGIQQPETLDTPRGVVRYGFNSEEEARIAGYGHWFTHDGVMIFAGGPPTPTGSSSIAVAVRPGRPANATD